MTEKRYQVSRVSGETRTIVASPVSAEEVGHRITQDAMAIPFPDLDRTGCGGSTIEEIENLRAVKAQLAGAIPDAGIDVLGHRYEFDEIQEPVPDDDLAAPPNDGSFFQIVRESQLSISIYPNEGKHRGRPHCSVRSSSRSANISLPDGEILAGDLGPETSRAVALVRRHGALLLKHWYDTRPGDQRLA